MKFKAGDVVRVKKDLEIGQLYDGEVFVAEMDKFRGRLVTIQRVNDIFSYYIIEEDNHVYNWNDRMFEKNISTEDDSIKKLQDELIKYKIQNAYLLGKLVAYEEKSNNKEEN